MSSMSIRVTHNSIQTSRNSLALHIPHPGSTMDVDAHLSPHTCVESNNRKSSASRQLRICETSVKIKKQLGVSMVTPIAYEAPEKSRRDRGSTLIRLSISLVIESERNVNCVRKIRSPKIKPMNRPNDSRDRNYKRIED